MKKRQNIKELATNQKFNYKPSNAQSTQHTQQPTISLNYFKPQNKFLIKQQQPVKQQQQQQTHKYLTQLKFQPQQKISKFKSQTIIKQRLQSGSMNFDFAEKQKQYFSNKNSVNSDDQSVVSVDSNKLNKMYNPKYQDINRLQINKNRANSCKNSLLDDKSIKSIQSVQSNKSIQSSKSQEQYQSKFKVKPEEFNNLMKLNKKTLTSRLVKNQINFQPVTMNKFLFKEWDTQQRETQLKIDAYPVPQGLKLNAQTSYQNNYYKKRQTVDIKIAGEIKKMHKGLLKSPIVPEGKFYTYTTSRAAFDVKKPTKNIMKKGTQNLVKLNKYKDILQSIFDERLIQNRIQEIFYMK